jgi:phage terminase small subunit
MLTQKQENFCLAVVEGRNYSDAYRRCYSTGRMKPATVNRNAKALLDDNKISARINELRDKAAKKVGITLSDHLTTMEDLRKKATRKTQFGAAVKAEECRAKASGLYVDIHRHEGPDGGPIQSIVTFSADDKLLAAIKGILKDL